MTELIVCPIASFIAPVGLKDMHLIIDCAAMKNNMKVRLFVILRFIFTVYLPCKELATCYILWPKKKNPSLCQDPYILLPLYMIS